MSDTKTDASGSASGKLLFFPSGTPAIGVSQPTLTASSIPEIAIETVGATLVKQVISIDRLWEGTSSQVPRALELLKGVSENLTRAKSLDDPLEADRYVQQVQRALPKLFACRSIGDGFGVIVNSLHFAFLNLQGSALSRDQLNVVWRVMRELREKPIMTLEQGIRRVQELESSGLRVDPPDLEALIQGAAPLEHV